jgi:hypothetical protein
MPVASLSYSGFTTYQLSLVEAVHSINGDVLSYLIDDDSSYVLLDTTAIISLKFSTSSIEEPDPTVLREYFIETNGRYIKGSTNASLTLNVVNPRANPYSYKLYINYPNPFNPKTIIKYEIAKTGLVKINVYDLLGRLVTTLVNENKSSGIYSVAFDGSNLASGVYIYRLESGNFTDVKKMVLIK